MSNSYVSRYRYSIVLLKQLVKTDFKLRYQGSVLGYLWSLLRPLVLFTILYVVFVKFLRIGEGIPYFATYLLLGIVVWNFFSELTLSSLGSVVSKGDLIRKINFPKYVIVVSSAFSAVINLFFNMLILSFFMLLQGTDVSVYAFLSPLLILELFIFSTAVGFFLSALYVRFRDISYIWELILQAGFYATPLLYPLSLVIDRSELAAKLMMLNPIAQVVQDLRYLLITPTTKTIADVYGSGMARVIPIAITILAALCFSWYFRARSRYFAEEV